jgi:hypothetical protein
MSSRFGASPLGPCHHSHRAHAACAASPPEAAALAPPALACQPRWVEVRDFRDLRVRKPSDASSPTPALSPLHNRRPRKRTLRKVRARCSWIFALHLRAVATWPASVCGWASEARISVEATPSSGRGSGTYIPRAPAGASQDRREGVEDEQRSDPLLLFLALMREAHKCFDLLSSHLVGVLRRTEALHVHRGNPALTNEIELCDELVGPEPATIGCPAEWREGW